MPVHLEPAEQKPLVSRQAAWRLVIIMTTLLVLALIAVVWGFMRQARIALTAPTPPVAAAAAESAAAVVTLAPGARIISASTDAGKLVLHVSTQGGDEVEIIDLATGRLTGQVRTGK